MKGNFRIGQAIIDAFVGLLDWVASLFGGDSSSGMSEGVSAERARQKRDRARSAALADQWEREDELKRQQGILPPDWRNQQP